MISSDWVSVKFLPPQCDMSRPVDGVDIPVVADTTRIVSQTDDCFMTTGRCAAGDWRFDWTGTLDYDGMFRVDLTLLPTAGKIIQKFGLEIPIRDSVAQLLHAMADGIRYPIRTSRLPTGEGRRLGCCKPCFQRLSRQFRDLRVRRRRLARPLLVCRK